MPVPMVAIKHLRYAGHPYTPGMDFEARDEADATVLRLTKLAVDAPVSEPVHADSPEPSPLPPPVFASDHSYRAETPEPPITPEPEESPAISEPEDVKDLEPEDESDETEASAPTRKRRTYKRKDLTAEGQ